MRNVHIHTYRSIPLYSTVIVVIIYTLRIKKIHYLSVTNVLNVSLFGHLFFFFFFNYYYACPEEILYTHFPTRTHFGHLSFDDDTFAVQKIQIFR